VVQIDVLAVGRDARTGDWYHDSERPTERPARIEVQLEVRDTGRSDVDNDVANAAGTATILGKHDPASDVDFTMRDGMFPKAGESAQTARCFVLFMTCGAFCSLRICHEYLRDDSSGARQ
jgi:hypothetical protein